MHRLPAIRAAHHARGAERGIERRQPFEKRLEWLGSHGGSGSRH